MMARTYMENNYRKRWRKIMIRNDEYSGWMLIADRWRASADIKRERDMDLVLVLSWELLQWQFESHSHSTLAEGRNEVMMDGEVIYRRRGFIAKSLGRNGKRQCGTSTLWTFSLIMNGLNRDDDEEATSSCRSRIQTRAGPSLFSWTVVRAAIQF